MEEIMGSLKNFSISREDEVIGVEDVWVEEGREVVRSGLIGKLISKKHVRIEVFRDIFQNIWAPEQGLEISKIDRDKFLFRFGSEQHRERGNGK